MKTIKLLKVIVQMPVTVSEDFRLTVHEADLELMMGDNDDV